MDKFESQFSDLDVQTSYMEDAMGSTTAVSTPQDQVDSLMRQMAEEANIQLQQDLAAKEVPLAGLSSPEQRAPAIGEEDGKLADRLRALRPAT
jgi:charged multivesicular body protein 1